MLKLFTSRSSEILAKEFSNSVRGKFADIFTPVWVIVQNQEVKEWLSLFYANEKGISANLKFVLPSEFHWNLYRLKQPEIPRQLPGDLNSMQWTLFYLFNQKIELKNKVPVSKSSIEHEKGLFQFCGQVADVFDLYQVYRPDMLSNWLQKDFRAGPGEEAWQCMLWRELNNIWDEKENREMVSDRALAHRQLIYWIEREEEFYKKLPKHLYVFGLSHLSFPVADLLAAISATSEVNYFSRYCRKEKDDPLYSLFSGWTKVEAENMQILKSLCDERGISVEEQLMHIPEGESGTGSITRPAISLHSCYNKRREVEVLKEEILDYLESHPDKGPEDILILIPEAEAYGQTIKTVFMSGENEGMAIPVSDLNRFARDEILHALRETTALLNGTLKASEVLQVLALEPVKSRYQISDDDHDLIEEWVSRNGIYHGDGTLFNTPYSWKKGVNQLMSGFAMQREGLQSFKEMIPDSGIVNSDQAMLAARIHAFIREVSELKDRSKIPQKPGNWIQLFRDILDRLFGEEDKWQAQKVSVHKKLDSLNKNISMSGFSEPVTFELAGKWILQQLTSSSSSSGRFGQGVTLSTYIPYRGLPFEFIAMLGMNEGVFPRQVIRSSFDLIHQNPRAGDRIIKEDDEYLFAETITAARSVLHLSYQGKDQHSDNKMLPSILVQQLQENTEINLTQTQHSLHPFTAAPSGEKSGEPETALYSKVHTDIADCLLNGNNSVTPFLMKSTFKPVRESEKEIPVNDIINFFTHPCKYYLTNELDIKNYDDIGEIKDRELFKIQGLDKYKLDDFILRGQIQGYSSEELLNYAEISHMVPEGLSGEKAFEKEQEILEELIQKIREISDEAPQIVDFELQYDGFNISGQSDQWYGDKFISVSVGRRKAKNQLRHWLMHLFLLAGGVNIRNSYYISKEGNSRGEQIEFIQISSANISSGDLHKYLDLYFEEGPLPDMLNFFPESSLSFASALYESPDNLEKAKARAGRDWFSQKYTFGAESEDFYNRQIWKGQNPLENKSFQMNARKIWMPYLKVMEVVK